MSSRFAHRWVAGWGWLVALVVVIANCGEARPPTPAPAYFRVREQGGVCSLVAPDATLFYSVGIAVVNPEEPEGDGPRYHGLARHGGDFERWSAATRERLDAWHVNTIGPWSRLRGRPYVIELSLSYRWIDVFGEEFERYVERAAEQATRRPDLGCSYAELDRDAQLIGYFTDNELAWGWGHAWSGKPGELSLFEYYAGLAPSAPGKKAWAAFLAETYRGDHARLRATWDVALDTEDLACLKRIAPRSVQVHAEAEQVANGFLERIAERYFEVTGRAMQRRLPHHLNLGTRLTPGFPDVVARVSGRHVDVLSLNSYTRDLDALRRELTRLHRVGGKPVMLTEFSFPARNNRTGNKNRGYAQAEVADDAERARTYERCVEMLAELPFVVGYHWFQYYDEPLGGRKDGESCNFGFVDVNDRVYEELAEAAGAANARILQQRAGFWGKPR